MSKFTDERDALHESGAVNLVVRGGRVSGVFGKRAQVPDTPAITNPFHGGVDITHDSNSNAPLLAVETGEVIYARRNADGAMDMFIGVPGKLLNGWRYVHNSRHYAGRGDKIARGVHIANMGATGNVNGPHVHLERYVEGVRVDPAPYLLAIAKSLSAKSVEEKSLENEEAMYRLRIIHPGHPEHGKVFLVVPARAKRLWIDGVSNQLWTALGVPIPVDMDANQAYTIFRDLDKLA